MEFQSSLIGLAIIAIAWILQLIYSRKGEIRKRFLIFYALGTAALVIDNIVNEYIAVGIANIIILLLACAVLIRYSKVQIDKSNIREVKAIPKSKKRKK